MLENLGKNSEVNNGRMLSAGAGVIGAEVIDIFEAPIILLASQAKYLADASNFFPHIPPYTPANDVPAGNSQEEENLQDEFSSPLSLGI